jgi:hypothetical protein
MRLRLSRAITFVVAAAVFAACADSPLRPSVESARFISPMQAKVCADPADPICAVFTSTVYRYDPTLGALPPGVSDWRLIITQFGGQLDFLGVVEHGGAPITDVQNMYLRFFIDNGDGALGTGDLQVVIVNSPSGATMHCGLVSTIPVGPALPTSSPSICETGGVSANQPGRFLFDGYRTADLSAPLWESQGFARLQAGEQRALFLVEVGNVITSSGGAPQLGAPTAPAARTDVLSVPSGEGGNGGGGNGGGNGGGDTDTTAPTITFSGNAGSYSILSTVAISCTASDASGIATSTCPSVNAAAYTFPLGVNTLNASATDNAGNTATASTSFTVTATTNDLCALATSFAANKGQATAMCAQLKNGTRPFINHVTAQRGKQLSVAHADILLRIAQAM